MTDLQIKTERLGQRILSHVEVNGAEPRFPPCCPCCLGPVDRGVVLQIRTRDGRRTMRLPACGACVRHAKIIDKLIPLIIGTIIASTLTFILLQYGWRSLLKVLRNPIPGLIVLIIMGAVGIVLVLLTSYTLKALFMKKACTDLTGGADLKVEGQKLIFTFESPEYARRFAKLNGDTPSGTAPKAHA